MCHSRNHWTIVLLFCAIFCVNFRAHGQEWQIQARQALKNGGGYVEDANGRTVFEHRGNEHFIPASTTKLITGLVALRILGRDYRFETELGLDDRGYLVIRGGGDPLLVSEELAALAAKVRSRIDRCAGIVLDTSLVDRDVTVDGSSETENPYDAPLGALVVNFNTVMVKKLANGTVVSGEAQTPLTTWAGARVAKLPPGVHRVNLKEGGVQYAGELIREFLRAAGVTVGENIEIQNTTVQIAKPLLKYRSSKPLDEVIRGMLRYSTNFTANQLFLTVGAQQFGTPATMEKGRLVVAHELESILSDDDFTFVEGAGLSRHNRVTPRQMVKVIKAWGPYKELLPLEQKIFRAKTGTLTGVSTLVGEMTSASRGELRFAVLVNDQVLGPYKFQVAKILYDGLQ